MEHEVWLVNDDPAQLMVQKRLLSKVVPQVRDFLSPLEALSAARETESAPYLVTDFQMPMMDGPELARQWYSLFPQTRILIVSASEVSRDDQRRVDALPADSVRLLTSYRIADLPGKAKLWFFSLDEQLRIVADEETDKKVRFDPSVLEKLATLGGEEFVQKTIERFLRSVPEKLDGLTEAAQASDLPQLHLLAHSLKGSCGLVGALSLARAADELEQSSAEGTNRDWLALIGDIEREIEVTFEILRRRSQ